MNKQTLIYQHPKRNKLFINIKKYHKLFAHSGAKSYQVTVQHLGSTLSGLIIVKLTWFKSPSSWEAMIFFPFLLLRIGLLPFDDRLKDFFSLLFNVNVPFDGLSCVVELLLDSSGWIISGTVNFSNGQDGTSSDLFVLDTADWTMVLLVGIISFSADAWSMEPFESFCGTDDVSSTFDSFCSVSTFSASLSVNVFWESSSRMFSWELVLDVGGDVTTGGLGDDGTLKCSISKFAVPELMDVEWLKTWFSGGFSRKFSELNFAVKLSSLHIMLAFWFWNKN